jgi:hypothetical protein
MSQLSVWIVPNGDPRYLGNKPPPQGLMLSTKYTLPDLLDSELKEFDLRDNPDYPVMVKDQNGRGACNGHSAASSFEDAWYISGQPYSPMSAWSVYAPLCNGRDEGSSIAEALQLVSDYGISEESYVPYGTIDPRRLTPEALANRGRYRIEIGCKITTFREMLVAAHMRMPFNYSVPVNTGFNNLDAEGVPDNRPGIHNHAVSAGFALKRSAKYKWLIPTRNSWSPKWGRFDGYFNCAEKTIRGTWFDGYCVLATISDPQFLPPALRT